MQYRVSARAILKADRRGGSPAHADRPYHANGDAASSGKEVEAMAVATGRSPADHLDHLTATGRLPNRGLPR